MSKLLTGGEVSNHRMIDILPPLTLRERVAKAILETDPSCDYEACRRRVLENPYPSDAQWWDTLHRQADNAITQVRHG